MEVETEKLVLVPVAVVVEKDDRQRRSLEDDARE